MLFLDEPTAGFDPEARREFHDLVLRLTGTGDMTIVLTTHDLSEAEKLADRIVILAHGRIIADGTASELAEQIAGSGEVRWTEDGEHFEQSTTEPTRFAFDLFTRRGEAIADLEVRRPSLEDTYMSLVHRAETGQDATTTARARRVVTR